MSDALPRATLEVVLLVLVVFLVQYLALFAGLGIELFALSAPLSLYPWTIVLSVYAHAGLDHLVANVLAILVFGTIVERNTTRARFHAFVLLTGAIAGMTEVFVGSILGPPPAVLGISGAAFALMGYVMTSNLVSRRLVGTFKLSLRAQLAIMIVLAAAITLVTGGERIALIAHFTGFLLGLLAGRVRLLRVQ